MNIDKALEHLAWKLKNVWKPSPKDIEAYNAILDYKEIVENKNLSQNESLAKLWIQQLILFSRTGSYDCETAIQSIDDILKLSVYEWCKVLQKELPMLRFESIGANKYPLEPKDYHNITKLRERRDKITQEFETELTEALLYEIKEDDVIKFVQNQITRIINKFEK